MLKTSLRLWPCRTWRTKEVVYSKFAYTTRHGAIDGKTQTKEVSLYNLDVVISVGYRVKSIQGTRFRQWATRILREMLLNRLDEIKRIAKLERRMDSAEGASLKARPL